MIEKIYGACPHDCPDTCSVITEVENGRAIKFYADPDHPITQGWLCGKVRPYLDHVYHPDRLQYPLKRVGPKGGGQWKRISWQAALAEIGNNWRAIIDQYGAEAILPYSYSGTLGLVQMSVTSTRFWNRLGASQLQRSICGAAAEFAVNQTLGARRIPAYEDLMHSKLLIVWGHNPASTAPHFMSQIIKAQREGCQLVVIDPRRTRTAKKADWHIMPKPGTDGALALGMAHAIVAENKHDENWLNNNTVGWPELRRRLADYPLERVAEITEIPADDILKLARLYVSVRPSVIKLADGVQRNHNGGQTARAICALPAVTGQYGVAGGGLMYSASGYVSWDFKAMNYWDECPQPGRWVNMNRLGAALLGEATEPPLKSLFVFGSNPAAIASNAGKVVAGLKREDLFTVVHELFMTDTADYADIVLPATSQLEQTDLHKAYGHATVSYNRQAIPPLGEAKSNWDVMRLLAAEMGFAEPWLQQDADAVIDEILAATAVSNPALKGITRESLQKTGWQALNIDPPVPFADGKFPTPSGKVELYSQFMADQGLDPLPGWVDVEDDGFVGGDGSVARNGRFVPEKALSLISSAGHFFVSSSLANQPGLLRQARTPFVEIHPDDAAARGIQHGEQVVVENGRGWCELRAVVTDGVRQGVVVAPKGRWSKLSNGRNINWTTSDVLGDMAGQSTYHSNRVWLRPKENEI